MWLRKRFLAFIVGVFLIAGIVVFSGCSKQGLTPVPETQEEVTEEQSAGTTQDEPAPAEKQEMVINGTFSAGIDGWVLAGGRIKADPDGNQYLEGECNWQNYQILSLEPNTVYSLNASTRKKNGEQEARLKLIFFDNHAQRLGWYSIHYKHQGDGWENIPTQAIKVPDGTKETILYLLADQEKEIHDFDNISLTKESTESTPVKGEDITVTFNTSGEKVVNGNFDSDSGWFGLENRIKTAEDGNRYLMCGYHWEVSQIISLIPGKEYKLNGSTQKGTSSGPARFVLVFFDDKGEKLPATLNLSYQHQGTEWENIPEETIIVPAAASRGRLYLLSDYTSTGYHYYDNLSINEVK